MNRTELSWASQHAMASGVRRMFEQAKKYDDAINLTLGEPGFATPDYIVEAAVKSLRAGATKYTPNAGIKPLRDAIAYKLQKENGIACDPDKNLIVTGGATQALMLAMVTLVDPGDEVILQGPNWPEYMRSASPKRSPKISETTIRNDSSISAASASPPNQPSIREYAPKRIAARPSTCRAKRLIHAGNSYLSIKPNDPPRMMASASMTIPIPFIRSPLLNDYVYYSIFFCKTQPKTEVETPKFQVFLRIFRSECQNTPIPCVCLGMGVSGQVRSWRYLPARGGDFEGESAAAAAGEEQDDEDDPDPVVVVENVAKAVVHGEPPVM